MKFKKITRKKLDDILTNHEKWLNGEDGGVQADLSCVDLGNLNLSYVNLSHADLSYANLSAANFQQANLSGAYLSDANLRGANLNHANLRQAVLSQTNLLKADLSYANLSAACLDYANLRGADLSHADMNDANLIGANLYGANLTGANLFVAFMEGANLFKANLYKTNLNNTYLANANLSHAILNDTTGDLLEFRKGKILTEPLIGYKKCRYDIIVTLEIPKGAVIFSVNGEKCRTNKVKVIAIDGTDEVTSWHNFMLYRVGDEITIDDFNCEYNVECAPGIHFFMNRKEAEAYRY